MHKQHANVRAVCETLHDTPHYPYQDDLQWLEHFKHLPYPGNLWCCLLRAPNGRTGFHAGCNDAVPEAGAPFRDWCLAAAESLGRDRGWRTIALDDRGVRDGPEPAGAPASGTA